jgi:hypothetical protein
MITNFKLFETKKSKLPNIGDYVFCNTSNPHDDRRIEIYCSTHIGKVIDVRNRNGKGMLPTRYTIEYKLPEELGVTAHSYIYILSDIEYWSKNIKDVELYMKSKKYNI